MSDFVPRSVKELYRKMLDWNALRGEVFFDGEAGEMTWIIAEDFRIEVGLWRAEWTVSVFDCAGPGRRPLTHWHSDAEEIYGTMLRLNDGGMKAAYVDTLTGRRIAYVGEPDGRERRGLRRLRFLGEGR